MSILTKYILLTGNPTELSLAFMTYVCFSTETVNLIMLRLQGYKFELKGEHVYVLVKVFLDTGADILLASQMFSKCLFMQSQPNISISGVLDEGNEIENIRSCKVVIPYKGERNIFSMNNRISKNVPTYFTRNLLCKYMGLTSTQFQMFNMDDYTLERDIDMIFNLENQLDVKTMDFECLDLFRSPLFPNIEIF